MLRLLIAVVVSIQIFQKRSALAEDCASVRDIDEFGEQVVFSQRRMGNDATNISNSAQNITNSNGTGMCNSIFDIQNDTVDPGQAPKIIPPWRVTYNKVSFVLSGIYFPVVTILALVGNALTISILRKDVLHSSSTVYLLGLAVADLLFGIALAPRTLKSYPSVSTQLSFKTFYSFYISYFFPLANTFLTTGVLITVSFTVERVIAVCFPMKAKKYSTKSRAQKVVVFSFVFGIGLNSVRFFRRTVVPTTDPVNNETYYTYTLAGLALNETFETTFFWVYFLVTKAIPFPVLSCLNSVVVWNVWRARWKRLRLTSKSQSNDGGKSREHQITFMLIAIVTAFLVCNAAAGCSSLYVALYGMSALQRIQNPAVYYMLSIGEALVNTNPLVNCILYTACSQTIRKELMKIFCPKRNITSTFKQSQETGETGVDA